MATKKVITPADLATTDFVIENDKVHVVHTMQEYQVTLSRYFTHNGNDADLRKIVRILNGQGIIHLDVRRAINHTSTWIGTLPSACPAPTHLVEVTVMGIGLSGQTVAPGTVYIDRGSREIMSTGLVANARYVVNLPAIFV